MSKDKAPKKDIVLENLKGFVRLGASSNIKGNVPTGHFDLDFVLHHGVLPKNVDLSTLDGYDPATSLGLPLGKLIEIFGEEGSGKSSLAYRIVGYAQKMGLKCAWIDTEHSFSEDLCEINGASKDDIYYSDMTNPADAEVVYFAESVFDAIVALCKSGVKVIVLDSVANLVPKARMEKNADEFTVGVIARLMSDNLGKIVNYAAQNGVLVVFINQLREKIGVMFGSPETSPGGRSLKHNASVRLQVVKSGGAAAEIKVQDENGDRVIGRKALVRIKKNRFAKPFTDSLEIPIYYEAYFPDIEELLFNDGRKLKVISVYKGTFKWNDLEIEGKLGFVNALKADKKLLGKLYLDLEAASEESGIPLSPEIVAWGRDNIADIADDVVAEAKETLAENEKKKEAESGVDNEKPFVEGPSTRGRKRKDSAVGDGVSS